MGPYNSERETWTEPMLQTHSDVPISGRPATRLAFLLQACKDAGVELGDFDTKIVEWLATMWEPTVVQVFIGIISRANKS